MGLAESRFWRMTPAEFERATLAWQERQEARQKERQVRFYDMLNAFGAVMVKDWKWQEPPGSGEQDAAPRRRTQREIAEMLRARGIRV